jgi:hypothetical protein
MKISLLPLTACLLACSVSQGLGAAFKWSGVRNPCKVSAEDGVTNLSTKIGRFLTITNEAEWAQIIFNVNNRFQGSTPWMTMAVGSMPDATLPSVEDQQRCLARMTELGVEVFLEIMPRKTNDVPAMLDEWLGRFKHHACVKGIGVDLEYYKRVDDAAAKAWDEKIKSHHPRYRMLLKHWEQGYMPPAYRGQGDIIFVNTSSEASVEALNAEFAQWAAHFAPSACAFQVGYPADEDGMDGKSTGGWWRLQDPIKDWGHGLLGKINNAEQELGLLWVCTKSGKSYNANWDLTRGATLAVSKSGSSNVISAAAPAIRPSAALERMTVLFDGRTLAGWDFSSSWTLVDGAMRGTGKGGNAFTKNDYGTFRLIVTSRVASPEGNPGRDHLGVLFWGERSTNFGTAKALQVQPPHGAMWDYRTNKGLKPEHPIPRPRPRYQDWHVCEILAKLETGEVRVAVDGIEITKYKHPDPSVLQRGPIGMQIHGSVGIFEYKDIRVETDPKEDRLITLKQ